MAIALPRLVAPTTIQSQNVSAAGVIYAASQFEAMKVFTVTDRIVELWQQGQLPVSRGATSRTLTGYWKDAPNRLTESERRSMYARTFGTPGGQSGPQANSEFSDLWLRFVSSVSAFAGQNTAEPVLRRKKVSEATVRKAGRDLAANLSLHGYGMGYFAATALQNQINAATAILSLPEIRSAYGARDMWQVVDTVATTDLGGAVNVARYRTLASTGLEIIRWLGAQYSAGRASNTTRVPSRALVKACEAWLVAGGESGEGGEGGEGGGNG